MCRKHFALAQCCRRLEREKITMKWVLEFTGNRGDVRADPRQHVIAAEQQASVLFHETEMSGSVPRCPLGAEIPTG